ncbi:MAG: rhodanese-like domain-containing protein [Anaerolineae bacterium]|nr:rhodanese-like domain-containing protein [Anaerolineae bacterium]
MFWRYLSVGFSTALLTLGLAACSHTEAASAPAHAAGGVASSSSAPGLASGRIGPQDYVARYVQAQVDHVLIDVRTPGEFSSGHISGALNIPLDQLSHRLSEIPKDRQVILYCRSGNRSDQAAALLRSVGYNNILDLGGIIAWQNAGYGLTH